MSADTIAAIESRLIDASNLLGDLRDEDTYHLSRTARERWEHRLALLDIAIDHAMGAAAELNAPLVIEHDPRDDR